MEYMNKKPAALILGAAWAAFYLTIVVLPGVAEDDAARADRAQSLRGSLGTFCGAPREDGDRTNIPVWYTEWKAGKIRKPKRVDVERLVDELADIRANTYHWNVWFSPADWDDLRRFLPLAAKKGITVWVNVMPPKQQMPAGSPAPIYSEPHRMDYETWAKEIAELSLREPNLAAWSIDDFSWDLNVFTPERLRSILEIARKINPRLAFVPCVYYPTIIKPGFAEKYADLFDGVLFPYRHDSVKSNLTDAGRVEAEVEQIRKVLGQSIPIVVDVYATDHTSLGSSTPEYVREVMVAARSCADGVHVYCHQSPTASPEKYKVVKTLFSRWSAEDRGQKRGNVEGKRAD